MIMDATFQTVMRYNIANHCLHEYNDCNMDCDIIATKVDKGITSLPMRYCTTTSTAFSISTSTTGKPDSQGVVFHGSRVTIISATDESESSRPI